MPRPKGPEQVPLAEVPREKRIEEEEVEESAMESEIQDGIQGCC